MSDTTNTLAEQLVKAADDAMFDPQGVRGIRSTKTGPARAAVVAALRTLRDATDDIGPMFAKGQRGFIDALADEVESQS